MYRKSICLLIVILSLILTGCGNNSDTNRVKNLSDIRQKILFTFTYVNGSYGFTYTGLYIDNDGNVYDFEIPDMDAYNEIVKMGFINYLLTMKEKKLVGTVDKNKLLKQFNLLLKVNKNAKMNNKSGDTDTGIQAWSGVLANEDGSFRSILIYKIGESNSRC